MDDSRAEKTAGRPAALPPYLVVLLVAAVAGIALMHAASGAWHAASEAQQFPADVRRRLVFAVLFNAGLAGALALAGLGEAAGAAFRLLRKRPALPVRVACAVAVLLIFVAGHHFANPWVTDIARAVRGAVR
jgi:hypothetical protein